MKLHIAGTQGFPTEYSCKTVGGGDYVFPETLADNVSSLHEFLYGSANYQVSERVKEISAAVQNKERGGSAYKTNTHHGQEETVSTEPEITEPETQYQDAADESVEENMPETMMETTEEMPGPGMVPETVESEEISETVEAEETAEEKENETEITQTTASSELVDLEIVVTD